MPLKLRSELPQIDSAPLAAAVVLVHFFALDCCQTEDHLQRVTQWTDDHAGRDDFQVIGIHSPRTDAERDPQRLAALLQTLQLPYPVLADDSGQLSVAFANEQVPCVYLFDKRRQLRHVQAGEVGVQLTAQRLRQLLHEMV
jgi:hypothetical protein